MARSKYDILLEELSNHQKTLDDCAESFALMSSTEKSLAVGAVLYSLRYLLGNNQKTLLPEIISHNKDYKSRFISIMTRLYVTLDIKYVPNCTATLKQWAADVRRQARMWLDTQGWN